MKLEQAARQALEALVVAEEFVDRHSEDWYISGQQDLKQIRESITALREALSGQAEQEPVAWMWTHDDGGQRLEWESIEVESIWKSTPLYTAPVRTKDLTDDEIFAFDNKAEIEPLAFARAVIAADREKNRG